MYDLIMYIFKYNKLDTKFHIIYDELENELNSSEKGISKSFDKKMKNIYKIQSKTIDIFQQLTNYLSQDDTKLNIKRKVLFIINILIGMIPTFLIFHYTGIFRIISIILATTMLGMNAIANGMLNGIIYSKEDVMKTLYDGVLGRNEELCELQDKYVNFIGTEINKIIKEKNIDINSDKNASKKVMKILKDNNINTVEEVKFYEDKIDSEAMKKEDNGYVFYQEEKNETYENEVPETAMTKTKSRKRIKKDGDK